MTPQTDTKAGPIRPRPTPGGLAFQVALVLALDDRAPAPDT